MADGETCLPRARRVPLLVVKYPSESEAAETTQCPDPESSNAFGPFVAVLPSVSATSAFTLTSPAWSLATCVVITAEVVYSRMGSLKSTFLLSRDSGRAR